MCRRWRGHPGLHPSGFLHPRDCPARHRPAAAQLLRHWHVLHAAGRCAAQPGQGLDGRRAHLLSTMPYQMATTSMLRVSAATASSLQVLSTMPCQMVTTSILRVSAATAATQLHRCVPFGSPSWDFVPQSRISSTIFIPAVLTSVPCTAN